MEWTENILQLPLLLAIIYIIAGTIFFLSPPKKINRWYGYRTPNSMASQDNWDFSQKFAAVEMVKCGVIIALISFLGFIVPNIQEYNLVICIISLLIAIIVPIARTEITLRKKFPKQKQ